MATNSQQLGRSGVSYIVTSCDSGAAFVLLSDVLNVLASLCERDSSLIRDADLRPDHPARVNCERWEIFSGRVAAMRVAGDQIRALPSRPADNLMGEKPILEALEAHRAWHRRATMEYAARASDILEPHPGFCDDSWNRHDAISSFIDDFLKQFPGSAEEQPGPREESRPVIGTGIACDTGRGESTAAPTFPDLSAMPDDALAALSEAALEEMETRGTAARWQPAVA